jgi:hypothetical protein
VCDEDVAENVCDDDVEATGCVAQGCDLAHAVADLVRLDIVRGVLDGSGVYLDGVHRGALMGASAASAWRQSRVVG